MQMSSASSSPPIPVPPSLLEGGRETIRSRFGDVTVDVAKAVYFPKGLLGMPEARHFVLTAFPNAKMSQFSLLQSLEDAALSFICLPLPLDNPIIEVTHLHEAAAQCGIESNELAVLAIVCVHRTMEGSRLSINARAPVLMDAARKAGVQYVLPNDKYSVQHFISD